MTLNRVFLFNLFQPETEDPIVINVWDFAALKNNLEDQINTVSLRFNMTQLFVYIFIPFILTWQAALKATEGYTENFSRTDKKLIASTLACTFAGVRASHCPLPFLSQLPASFIRVSHCVCWVRAPHCPLPFLSLSIIRILNYSLLCSTKELSNATLIYCPVWMPLRLSGTPPRIERGRRPVRIHVLLDRHSDDAARNVSRVRCSVGGRARSS